MAMAPTTETCNPIEIYRRYHPNPKTLAEFREYEQLLQQKLARCENRLDMNSLYLQGDYSRRAQKKAEKEAQRLGTKCGKLTFKLRVVKSRISELELEETINRARQQLRDRMASNINWGWREMPPLED